MSETTTNTNNTGDKATTTPEDLSKLKETVGTLQQTNKQILDAINAMKTAASKPQPKPEPKETKTAKDLWFDDPDAAAALIEERAERRIQERLQVQQQQQMQTNNTMRGLYKEFPELQDLDHPLTQKAIEIFEKLSDEEKTSPLAYKLSVKDAAEELDIKPKGKRKVSDEDDSFSLGNSNTRTNPEGSRGGNAKAKKLDPRTVEFAKFMGLNMDDPKTVERLTKRAQRDTWLKYR